jgi:hypothetical protein
MAVLNTTRLQYEARRLGWQGLAGLVLIGASLVAAFSIVLPQAERLRLLENEAAQLRRELPRQRMMQPEQTPLEALAAFYDLLPDEHAIAGQIALLLSAASDHDLAPDKAEYAVTRSTAADFVRYQITLPVRGSYPDIRKFANQALHDLPAAALNEIAFQRENIDSDEVEARLRFTLFLHRERP